MIIIVEGPEKAGKTTFINALDDRLKFEGYKVERRKLGADKQDDSRYSPMLQTDVCKLDTVVIWDRGWVSEYVYATMLGRERRLAHNPWLGEWIHSRAVRPNGALFMVLPQDPAELEIRRDDTDLPVDPYLEYGLFLRHAADYDWQILAHSYTGHGLEKLVDTAMETVYQTRIPETEYLPPNYAGPIDAELLCVAPIFENSFYEGAWLPGSSEVLTRLGFELGPVATSAAWTTPENLTERMANSARVLVTIGQGVLDKALYKLPVAQTIEKYPRIWDFSPAWLSSNHVALRAQQILSSMHQNWWKQHAPNN